MRGVFRIVDTETTGFDPEVDKIVEIGARDMLVDGDHVVLTPIASHLCDPGIPIPPEARAIHHISDRMVKTAKRTCSELVERLLDPATETGAGRAEPLVPWVLVAHNAEFDSKFIAAVNPAPVKWLCTLRLAKHLLPDAPSYKNEVLRYWLWPELELEGVPHRAAHDVDVTTYLLAHLLEKFREAGPYEGPDPTPFDLIDFAESPVMLRGKIGFGKHFEDTWADVAQKDSGYLQWMRREGEDAWDRDQWFTIHRLLGYQLPQKPKLSERLFPESAP